MAREATRMVCTMRRRRVKMQEPSMVAIKEGWGTSLDPREIMRKEKRRMRRREEGWLAGRRRLRMPRRVSRAEGTKIFWMWLEGLLVRCSVYVMSK